MLLFWAPEMDSLTGRVEISTVGSGKLMENVWGRGGTMMRKGRVYLLFTPVKLIRFKTPSSKELKIFWELREEKYGLSEIQYYKERKTSDNGLYAKGETNPNDC